MTFRWMPWLVAAALALSGCPKPEAAHEAAPAEVAEPGVVKMALDVQRREGVRVEAVAMQPLTLALTATGAFQANADKEAHVSPRVAARVLKVYKTVGDRVRAGEPLALLESLEVGRAEAEYLESQARAELGRSTLQRQHELFKSDLTAKKELLAAENQQRVNEIDLERTRNQLRLFGFTDARLAELARSRRIDPTMTLSAPIGGVVIAKHITLGETLAPDAAEPAFLLSDNSALWVDATLYERDLARVHEGQAVQVSTPAYPGRTYPGRVSLISTVMDQVTRTAKARVVVANADGRLKPEMFANVRIETGTQQVLALPQRSVLREKEEVFVLVQTDPETFKRRPVKLGAVSGGAVEVKEGLQAGEKVAVDGAFTLKSELLKASFGEE
jgi:cobalt-zinc-cadmium efflux system membrane fusion protein